jgi:hypothetical protein
MKLFDLKAAITGTDNKTHWRTIGTVFAGDDGSLLSVETGNYAKDGKAIMKNAGFIIDYPNVQGVIVPRPKKEKSENDKPQAPDTSEGT